MAIKFFYWPFSSATRVQWALEELGVPYEKHRINREQQEHRQPDFLAINPNGKVPAMQDDGANMFESLAMILHLGDKYGVDKGLWPRSGTPERAEAYSWCVWGTAELHPHVIAYILHAGERTFSLPKDQQNPLLAERAKKSFDGCLAILDKRLANREYLVGKSFSLADVALAGMVAGAPRMTNGGLDFTAHKNVAAWAQRCAARPALGKAIADA